MNITYRTAAPADAAQLLEYTKTVGSQTDNLTFGADGIPFTVEQEADLLARMAESPHSRFFLALEGDRIVGSSCVNGFGNPRLRHRATIAITVLREYWGLGVGSGLMERMIAFARETGAELLSLEVRSDNERAKALYRKFGFKRFGTFPHYFKINGQYHDVDCMTLLLETGPDNTKTPSGGRTDMIKVYCYSKCSTCKKALRWLTEHDVAHEVIDLKEHHPDEAALRTYYAMSGLPLRRFFNTSGMQYRALELSKKLPEMPEDEQLRLLAGDGMLVKRPLLAGPDFVLVGFNQAEWESKLL